MLFKEKKGSIDFKAIAVAASKSMSDNIPSDEELGKMYSFSPEFERKMAQIINDPEADTIILGRRLKWGKYIAIAALIAAIIAATMSVGALRNAFLSLFMNDMGDGTAEFGYVQTSTSIDASPSVVKDYFAPAFTAKGYTLKNKSFDSLGSLFVYSDDKGNSYYFSQGTLKGRNYMSSDFGDSGKALSINGFDAQYVSNDGYSVLYWTDGNYIYTIIGQVSMEDAVKCAESNCKIIAK